MSEKTVLEVTEMRSTPSAATNGGWKWAAFITGAVLLALVACLIGCLFGLLIGAAISNNRRSQTSVPEYYLPPTEEWPLPTPYQGSGQARLGVRYTMTAEGALIQEVETGTAAEEAGLQVGDIITAVDGKAVNANHPLAERILSYNAGDEVTLTILRNGREQKINVRLGAWTDLPLQLPIQ
jgi:predicted metalloprotease with PDZ domain